MSDSKTITDHIAGTTKYRWTTTGLVSLLTISAAVLVQFPYFNCGHVWDDLRHLHQIGETWLGRLTWKQYLFTFHNEHQLCLWKIWYWECWRFFGLNPWGWHLTIVLAQAISAVALHGICRSVGCGSVASLSAAILWAGASIGGFDNPLIWIAASHLAWSLMWLLLATWCALRYRHRGGAQWCLLVGLFVAAGCLTMSAMAVFSLILPLIVFSSKASRPVGRSGLLFVAWGIPVCLTFVLQGLAMLNHQTAFAGSPGIGWQFFAALANTFGNSATRLVCAMTFDQALIGLISSLFLIGTLPILEKECRRVATAILVGSLVYTGLAVIARADFPPAHFAALGRFTYLPTLAWCMILAGVLGQIDRWGRSRVPRLLTVGLTGLFVCFLLGQRLQASRATAQFADVNRPSYEPWRENLVIVDHLIAEARSKNAPWALPDLPVPSRSFLQQLSTLIACSHPEAVSDLQVQPFASLTVEEIATYAEYLASENAPGAESWRQMLELASDHRQGLALIRAASTNRRQIRFPPLLIPLPGNGKPIRFIEWLQILEGANVMESKITVPASLSRSDIFLLKDTVKGIEHPFAQEIAEVCTSLLEPSAQPIP